MDIDKGFSIMVRMGLINEYDRTLKKHKFVLEESIDDIILEGVHRSYEIDDMVRILNKHYNIDLEDDFLETGADIGILEEGLRIIGSRTPEFTLVDYPTMDGILSNEALKSSDRLKQEIETHKFL